MVSTMEEGVGIGTEEKTKLGIEAIIVGKNMTKKMRAVQSSEARM